MSLGSTFLAALLPKAIQKCIVESTSYTAIQNDLIHLSSAIGI
jgi:hypothetical protein